MSSSTDADLTLPSVTAALSVEHEQQWLRFTIVYHPDTARIGHTALVPDLLETSSWVMGRRSPVFAGAISCAGAALDERDISRQALALTQVADGIALRRLPGASRCRVMGAGLDDHITLPWEQLRAGVPLLLGHSVVLLLRWGSGAASAVAESGSGELRGSSPYMNRLREQIEQVGCSGLDVLVRGETGTGKELVAAALHRSSQRASGPMVNVNMAAIPPGLAAATLFGSARGAYTGSTRANAGFFSQADGGTLFLDEIGDTPAEVQPQLLRALQQREIQAVGGGIHKVDVRVVSATDATLEGENCDFSSALRHRLGAVEINLLPLREHPEDIGELLAHFLDSSSRALGRTPVFQAHTSSALETASWAELFYSCLRYDWPGNVRELANCASQVVVASANGCALPDKIRVALQAVTGDGNPAEAGVGPALKRRMGDVDESEFTQALRDSAYEVAKAARLLGVSRQSVYRRMGVSGQYRLAGQVPQAELERVLSSHGGDTGAAALDLKISLSSLRSRLRGSGLTWF